MPVQAAMRETGIARDLRDADAAEPLFAVQAGSGVDFEGHRAAMAAA